MMAWMTLPMDYCWHQLILLSNVEETETRDEASMDQLSVAKEEGSSLQRINVFYFHRRFMKIGIGPVFSFALHCGTR